MSRGSTEPGPSSPPSPAPQRRSDLVSIFARHRTAPNLLMILLVLLGFVALNRMNTQFFPDFGIDFVSVNVEWSGASATDVDANIVQAIEPEVRFLDGVRRVRSLSYEGLARINIEFEPGTDMQAALNDVQTASPKSRHFPRTASGRSSTGSSATTRSAVLIVTGPYTEAALKAKAKRIRNELLQRGIDRVDIFGSRKEEIHVEIKPETLRRLGLTLDEVARKIRETSRDIPSGDTKGASERQLRSLGLLKTADGIRGVEVRSLANGQKIRVGQIATVGDRFRDKDPVARFAGQRAIEIHIQRATNADALKLANIVQAYLKELRPTLPPGVQVIEYDIQADLIRSRITLLLKNGAGGLVLVLIVLFVFLNGRVAFWVAAGIPVALFATMVVMLASGQSINMVSLFGLIMTLGIVVDDAIVVGEHAEARWRQGLPPLDAAEAGARRMLAPVVSSSLTTIAAFMPLFLISDIIGQIVVAIPMVVIAVIIASLVECFLVLPGHLRGAFVHARAKAAGFRVRFDRGFEWFSERVFLRFVRLCLSYRYATLATALAALIVSLGLIQGGRLAFVFFPSPEVDKIYANVEFAPGTPREITIKMLDRMERALAVAERAVGEKPGALVRTRISKVATPVGAQIARAIGGSEHTGGIIVELVPSDKRTVTADQFMTAWRKAIKPMAGVVNLTITPAQAGPPGKDVDVRLLGGQPAILKKAALEVRALLRRYPGVSNIDDDLPYGKFETIVRLTPRGKALGFTTESVGTQLRAAFDGAVAMRFARGDEEVLVRVRNPRGNADQAALNALYLRSPRGMWVPLSAVVSFKDKVGFSRINREDGTRQVAVTAELNKALNTTDKIISALETDGIKQIASKYGVTIRYAGKAEEQQRTFGDMRLGALVGGSMIYIILAWVFASYTRPLVVMSVIPLGFVGAVIGHLLLGFDLTILSMVALIGLSGIVVNDSIILVSTIDERIRNGEPLMSAIANGARDRLRAVILTSLTTIGGILPLIFETDLQAQFLIPMAITLAFGLLVATLLVLIVVPALIAIQGDIGRLRARFAGRRTVQPAE